MTGFPKVGVFDTRPSWSSYPACEAFMVVSVTAKSAFTLGDGKSGDAIVRRSLDRLLGYTSLTLDEAREALKNNQDRYLHARQQIKSQYDARVRALIDGDTNND